MCSLFISIGKGLKQGCATLSDLSFVLVKNGSNSNIELGIVAEQLQTEHGCYLPAFQFALSPTSSLKDQMISKFSDPQHAGVKQCIAQYGAASHDSDPDFIIGVERICRHYGDICKNFDSDRYLFMVILDKLHHHQTNDYVKNAWDAQQKKVCLVTCPLLNIIACVSNFLRYTLDCERFDERIGRRTTSKVFART